MRFEVQLHWNKCTPANMKFICQEGIWNAAKRCYDNAQQDIRVCGAENFTHRAQVIRDLEDNEVGFVTIRRDRERSSETGGGDSVGVPGDQGSEEAAGGPERREFVADTPGPTAQQQGQGDAELDIPI